jgi:hypothetical protein
VPNRDDELAVLTRGLDQAAALLGSVGDDDLDGSTPCRDWTTAKLADHLVAAPANFAQMLRGEAFGPEQPAPEGADSYQRIAAFAGRTVTPSR